MTIRHSLLALLAQESAHGYGLKSSFERSTAGAWPLNVGQVYTTLARLERDGLVEAVDADDDRARRSWRLTDAGHQTLEEWYDEPVAGDPPARDELAIKVLVAIAADTVDVTRVLQRQRTETLERLQRYTRQKAKADPDAELPWVLLLDALILKAKAEVDWLELCEQRLAARDA